MDNREYLVKSFDILTSQRMKSFDFYILINSFFVAGVATLVSGYYRYSSSTSGDLSVASSISLLIVLIVCIGMVYFSYVFQGLDRRTSDMISLTMKHMIKQEKIDGSYSTGLFTESSDLRKKLPDKCFSTYEKCFNCTFNFFRCIGILGCVLTFLPLCYQIFRLICPGE